MDLVTAGIGPAASAADLDVEAQGMDELLRLASGDSELWSLMQDLSDSLSDNEDSPASAPPAGATAASPAAADAPQDSRSSAVHACDISSGGSANTLEQACPTPATAAATAAGPAALAADAWCLMAVNDSNLNTWPQPAAPALTHEMLLAASQSFGPAELLAPGAPAAHPFQAAGWAPPPQWQQPQQPGQAQLGQSQQVGPLQQWQAEQSAGQPAVRLLSHTTNATPGPCGPQDASALQRQRSEALAAALHGSRALLPALRSAMAARQRRGGGGAAAVPRRSSAGEPASAAQAPGAPQQLPLPNIKTIAQQCTAFPPAAAAVAMPATAAAAAAELAAFAEQLRASLPGDGAASAPPTHHPWAPTSCDHSALASQQDTWAPTPSPSPVSVPGAMPLSGHPLQTHCPGRAESLPNLGYHDSIFDSVPTAVASGPMLDNVSQPLLLRLPGASSWQQDSRGPQSRQQHGGNPPHAAAGEWAPSHSFSQERPARPLQDLPRLQAQEQLLVWSAGVALPPPPRRAPPAGPATAGRGKRRSLEPEEAVASASAKCSARSQGAARRGSTRGGSEAPATKEQRRKAPRVTIVSGSGGAADAGVPGPRQGAPWAAAEAPSMGRLLMASGWAPNRSPTRPRGGSAPPCAVLELQGSLGRSGIEAALLCGSSL
ncbi:hypothetical protein MNEG_5783 [Monoraphidium neglectum]|uniref:Uncharacterized protein n=1 Tax=Monoraphidium neglectum TaxID=145388 RepID=A0A0D2L569_9CHLO|nr:hypothetical protein MNEG_5783 [Monoraphidium neglectum]KIZ02179.1 hypothetical protein MNEG_5783 [Monoraphidium neglectum]|eukprot:XP_013901198.1 hypothetical protein MNEG_5783 [Monoraphidium neglectum]